MVSKTSLMCVAQSPQDVGRTPGRSHGTHTEGEPLPGSGALLQLRWREMPCFGEAWVEAGKPPEAVTRREDATEF